MRERLRRLGRRHSQAADALARIERERDQAIRDAAAARMTRRAIAAEVGVSYTRVQQIVKSADAASEKAA
jgi:hypothetical protein